MLLLYEASSESSPNNSLTTCRWLNLDNKDFFTPKQIKTGSNSHRFRDNISLSPWYSFQAVRYTSFSAFIIILKKSKKKPLRQGRWDGASHAGFSSIEKGRQFESWATKKPGSHSLQRPWLSPSLLFIFVHPFSARPSAVVKKTTTVNVLHYVSQHRLQNTKNVLEKQ